MIEYDLSWTPTLALDTFLAEAQTSSLMECQGLQSSFIALDIEDSSKRPANTKFSIRI